MTSDNDAQRSLLLTVGFGAAGSPPGVILMRLNDQEAHSDPYDWRGDTRTMPTSHTWLLEHFDEIDDGFVLDVEFILGETVVPKRSEFPTKARYWRKEPAGIQEAVEVFLSGYPMSPLHIVAMREYLRQWINDPRWQGATVTHLRRLVTGLEDKADIQEWVNVAIERGLSPL